MTEDGLDYVKYLSFLLGSSLNENVINGPNGERDGLWAPACTDHCMSWKQGSKKVGGSEHWEVFSNWCGLSLLLLLFPHPSDDACAELRYFDGIRGGLPARGGPKQVIGDW